MVTRRRLYRIGLPKTKSEESICRDDGGPPLRCRLRSLSEKARTRKRSSPELVNRVEDREKPYDFSKTGENPSKQVSSSVVFRDTLGLSSRTLSIIHQITRERDRATTEITMEADT
ncbi:hypothetical protein Bca4012_019993 [Brassica carinata]